MPYTSLLLTLVVTIVVQQIDQFSNFCKASNCKVFFSYLRNIQTSCTIISVCLKFINNTLYLPINDVIGNFHLVLT